ncbi:unnamed protein product [Cercospora beticola]|nr:unnamed protein product [Cercospora beticola]
MRTAMPMAATRAPIPTTVWLVLSAPLALPPDVLPDPPLELPLDPPLELPPDVELGVGPLVPLATPTLSSSLLSLSSLEAAVEVAARELVDVLVEVWGAGSVAVGT